MYFVADRAGNVTAVDPMEALTLSKTKQRTATITRQKLSSPTIAQGAEGNSIALLG
jgi:hypothetical protein